MLVVVIVVVLLMMIVMQTMAMRMIIKRTAVRIMSQFLSQFSDIHRPSLSQVFAKRRTLCFARQDLFIDFAITSNIDFP
jgi:hypothetical protein